MIKIIIESKNKKILKENTLEPGEFPSEKGWQHLQSMSAKEDLSYPVGDGFVEIMGPKFNLNYSHPTNVNIGVINMVPISQTEDGPMYEEYINENLTDPSIGMSEAQRHIAPGRVINFGFVGLKNNRTINVLIVSVDGDDFRMFARTIK